MVAIIDKWTPLKKTFRLWRRMSYLYIAIGIAILFIAADMTDMITAIIHCAFSFLFGALLGYISSAYDLRMCGKEYRFWNAYAGSNGLWSLNLRDAVTGRKWYTWLFYFVFVLFFLAGLMLQMIIPRHASSSKFTLYLFSGLFITTGTYIAVWSWMSHRILSKLNGLKDNVP